MVFSNAIPFPDARNGLDTTALAAGTAIEICSSDDGAACLSPSSRGEAGLLSVASERRRGWGGVCAGTRPHPAPSNRSAMTPIVNALRICHHHITAPHTQQ